MRSVLLVFAFLLPAGVSGWSQTPATATGQAAAAPHQSGTVKAITPHDFVLTTAAGQDFAVTVPPSAHILLVPPDNPKISAAQPGTMSDIAAGDRALVSGTPGDSGAMLNASRVIVMKSAAIAANRAAEQAAWARGAGGIVRSIDSGTGVITLASGLKTLTVDTNPQTTVRRYAGSSVRFEDAALSSLAAIRPGDQMRVRGQRSPDGTTIVADAIVAGSFANFSGVLTAVDPTAGTVTLRDLATKRPVTVSVTPQSNLRHLPVGAMAAHEHGEGAHGAGSQGGAAGTQPAGGETHTGGAEHAGGAPRMDLSRILNRLPTVTLGDLKAGDAVMIVAANSPGAVAPVAITLLSGVEQVLAAHPSGDTTLSPWSLGEAPAEGEGESATP